MMKNLFTLGVVILIAFSCNNANILPTEEAVKDVLVLTQKAMEVPSIANELNVELKHNIETEVVIPDTVKWVAFFQSKGTTTSYLNFQIEKNTTTVKRVAKITVQQKGGELKDVLVIEQKGADQGSPSSGGLHPILAAMTPLQRDTTAYLKLTGLVTPTDFEMIRYRLSNLLHLDLSEATTPNNAIPVNALAPAFGASGGNRPLLSLEFPKNTVIIEAGAFSTYESAYYTVQERPRYGGARKISNIAKLDYLEHIERNAFSLDRDLDSWSEHLILPKSLRTIGEEAFCHRKLEGELIIPEHVTYIGRRAFKNCKINALEIGSKVSIIDDEAFLNGCSLNELIIPSNVTRIGARAFKDCGMKSVKVSWSTPIKWEEDMLPSSYLSAVFPSGPSYTPPPRSLYVPTASIALYKAADGWKDYTIIGY